MSSLKDNIEPLESDMKAVPPRISVYHDLPFAIMRYDPTDEWELRREIKLLAIHTVRTRMAAGLPADPTCTSQASTLSLPGIIAYVVENNHYRITEVHDYLETFTNPDQADRNVDLVIAHLVDYDWWLRNGKANGTTLQRQVGVMAEISVYTRGQVHAFVAFDPLREVAYRCRAQHSSHNPWSSMELVTKAIGEQGCLGVKLYPPMVSARPAMRSSHPISGICPDFPLG
jgi:hypothetical protein